MTLLCLSNNTNNTVRMSNLNLQQHSLKLEQLTSMPTNVSAATTIREENTIIDRIDRSERRTSVGSSSNHGLGNTNNNEMVKLPKTFVPGPFDVLCARGKAALQHSGNCRFRSIIKEWLPKYEAAPSKLDKSLIVSSIVGAIREATPHGGFVKEMDGIWYEVGDHSAREKCGQCLRDLLHDKYKSSTKAKSFRKKKNQSSHSFDDVDVFGYSSSNECSENPMDDTNGMVHAQSLHSAVPNIVTSLSSAETIISHTNNSQQQQQPLVFGNNTNTLSHALQLTHTNNARVRKPEFTMERQRHVSDSCIPTVAQLMNRSISANGISSYGCTIPETIHTTRSNAPIDFHSVDEFILEPTPLLERNTFHLATTNGMDHRHNYLIESSSASNPRNEWQLHDNNGMDSMRQLYLNNRTTLSNNAYDNGITTEPTMNRLVSSNANGTTNLCLTTTKPNNDPIHMESNNPFYYNENNRMVGPGFPFTIKCNRLIDHHDVVTRSSHPVVFDNNIEPPQLLATTSQILNSDVGTICHQEEDLDFLLDYD